MLALNYFRSNIFLVKVKSLLPLTELAMRLGYKEIFVPIANAEESALVKGITVYGARTLKEVVDHIYKIKYDKNGNPLEKERSKILPPLPASRMQPRVSYP